MDVALDRLLIPGAICPPRRPVLCAAYNSSSTPQSVQFRPCIDIHKGKVKQIVGSTLSDQPGSAENLVTNFESEKSAAEYAQLYQRDGLFGGHVIMLGLDEASQHSALEAVSAFPAMANNVDSVTVKSEFEAIDSTSQRMVRQAESERRLEVILAHSYQFIDEAIVGLRNELCVWSECIDNRMSCIKDTQADMLVRIEQQQFEYMKNSLLIGQRVLASD
ncbi:hypothetical protein L7F22_048195 [Adiantum nelumboides]|nr:hypothetical protein [Adiantum nelumboides]